MTNRGYNHDSNALFGAELKLVTSLFVDLVGSLEAISDIGTQQAALLLSECRSALTRVAHRHSGTVATIAGDGILFLFGAPHASSKQASNACLAALDMIEETKAENWPLQDTKVRIGICSGETLVKPVSTDIGWHYDATGVSVHLASRLQAIAEPDTAITDRLTRDLAQDGLLFEELGGQNVRGVTNAIPVFRLKKISRSAKVGLHSERSPFVGREKEVTQLVEICRRSSSGSKKVVVVAGDAGIGKSRLIFETQKNLKAEALAPTLICRGFYGLFDSFSGIRTCIEQLIQNSDLTSQERFLARSLQGVSPEKVSAKDETSLKNLFSTLFGTAKSESKPKEFQLNEAIAQKITVVRRGFETLVKFKSNDNSFSIFVDEFFELDSESREIFYQLMARDSDFEGNFIISCRPERLAELLEREITNIQLMNLAGLDEEASTILARALKSGIEGSQIEESRQVFDLGNAIRKSDGNPLFLIEIVNALVFSRSDSKFARPTSGDLNFAIQTPFLQTVIAERIDQLDQSQKQCLKVASILGEVIPETLLSKVLYNLEFDASAVDRLISERILGFTAIQSGRGLCFKHPLFREIAEKSIIERDRISFHIAAFRVLEKSLADGNKVSSLSMAYHANSGQLWAEACEGFLEAAAELNERAMNSHALDLLDQALCSSNNLNDVKLRAQTRVKILLEMRNPLYQVADLTGVANCLKKASEALIESEEPRVRGRILAFESHMFWLQGLPSLALKSAQKINQIASEYGDETLRVRGEFHKGLANFGLEKHTESLRHMQNVFNVISSGSRDAELGVNLGLSVLAKSYMARSLVYLDRPFEGNVAMEDALEIVAQSEDIFAHIIAQLSAGAVYFFSGDQGRSASGFNAAGRFLEAVEARLMQPIFEAYFGCFKVCTGNIVGGKQLIIRSIGESNDIGLGLELGRKYLSAGLCCLATGDRNDAAAAFQAGIEASSRSEAHQTASILEAMLRYAQTARSESNMFEGLSTPPFENDPVIKSFVRSFSQTSD